MLNKLYSNKAVIGVNRLEYILNCIQFVQFAKYHVLVDFIITSAQESETDFETYWILTKNSDYLLCNFLRQWGPEQLYHVFLSICLSVRQSRLRTQVKKNKSLETSIGAGALEREILLMSIEL